MKLVDRKTGAIVDVPDDQAQAAYMSGKYGVPKGAPMPIKTQMGIVGQVDPTDAALALSRRGTVPTEAEYRQAENERKFGSVGAGVEAGVIGAARGAASAFGLPLDAALTKFAEDNGDAQSVFSGHDEVDPYQGARHISPADALREHLKGLQEAHPIASQAGELAGFGAGVAMGGGLPGGAAKTALGAMGREALTGAGIGLIGGINEAALGDERVTAGKLLASVGHGALIGGALGGGLHLGGEAVAGVRDRLGRWLSTMKPDSVDALARAHFGVAGEGIGEKVQQAYARMSSAASGKDADVISKFTELSPEGAEARRVGVFDAPKIQDEAERAVRRHVDDMLRSGDLVSAEARGGLKAEYVDRAIKQGNEAETRAFSVDKLDDVIRGTVEQLNDPSGVAPSMKKALRSVRDLAERARAIAFGGGEAAPELRFKPHGTAKPGDGTVTVMVNADALDHAWSKDTGFHIGEGEEGIGGRRKAFQDWRAENPKEAVQASRITVDKDGRAAFTDGRHRFAELRDSGVERVAVTLPKEDLKRLGEEWGVGPLSEPSSQAASQNGQLFVALDQLKRGMQRLTSAGYRGLGNIVDPVDQINARRTVTWLDGAAADLRSSLEDSDLWGKAADDQRAINAAWTKQIDASKRFHRALTTEVGRDPNNPYLDILGADPAKVSTYVRNLTNPNNDLTHQAVRDYVESTRDLTKAIRDSYDLPADKVAEVDRVHAAADSFHTEIGKAEKSLVTANQYRQLLEQPEGGSFASALGTIGGIVGGLPGGILGTVASAVHGAVQNPGKMIAKLAALERLASKVDNDIARGVTDFLSGAKAPVEEQASVGMLKGLKNERQTFEAQVNEVRRLAGAKDELVARIQRFTSQFEDAAPGIASALTMAAVKGIDYLAQTAPPGFQPRPEALAWGIDEPPLYTDAEMREWSRRAAVVNDPNVALKSMKRKKLTPEEADALRNVHDPIFEALQREFMVQRTTKKTPMDRGQRLQIEVMFGVPLDRAMEPGFMHAVQQTFAVPEPHHARPSVGGASRMVKSRAGTADSIRGGY